MKYTFNGVDLCNDENGIPIKFIEQSDLSKNGIGKIFSEKQIIKKDSLIVNFKIISDCCQQPSDSIKITENEILIIPKFKNDVRCDCYCDYLFEYKFLNKDLKGINIKISDKKIY